MLIHTQCGGIVVVDSVGNGKCPKCGKTIYVRISAK